MDSAHLLAWLGDMGVNYRKEMDDTDCTKVFTMRSSLESQSQNRLLPIHSVREADVRRLGLCVMPQLPLLSEAWV